MFYFKKLKKKNTIPVFFSKTIKIIYCEKNSFLLFIGPYETKSLELKTKIVLLPNKNKIVVTDHSFFKKRMVEKNVKNLKKIQGTTVSNIRQILIEIVYTLYYQLNLFGVGYKIFSKLSNNNNQLNFKLGFSHLIYFKIPNSFSVNCQRFTKLFLFGNASITYLSQIVFKIKYLKFPEPYKGKGFRFDTEQIILKKQKN